MLKRLFQVHASSTEFSTYPEATPEKLCPDSAANLPQPIASEDQGRLIKVSAPNRAHTQGIRPAQSANGSHANLKTERSLKTGDSHKADSNKAPAIHVTSSQWVSDPQHLRQVERRLRQTLNFSNILGTAVLEIAALFEATQVALLKYDETARSFQPESAFVRNQALGWQARLTLTAEKFPTLFQSLSSQQSIQLCSAQASSDERALWLERWPGNWLLLPIALQSHQSQPAQAKCWGVLAIALPTETGWIEDAIAAAESLTLELSWAITQSLQHQALQQANEALQKLALSDGLTRLANRRRFDEHLNHEWQRLARDQQPLSLILCDLDHFKRYNDTFGHPAGDRCLIRVARALLNGPQRPADLVARYGGEEFAIILPNTDTHGAWRIAQKIHESVRALKIEHADDNPDPYVTVTMGVSTVIPGHSNTPQMLVQASDLALYHAKQQGRNRTYINGHYNTVSPEHVMNQMISSELSVMPAD